jgi:hypothetical protein
VYSASDFERFETAIEASARRKADSIITEAEKYAMGRLRSTETEERKRLLKSLEEMEQSAEAFRKKERSRTEMDISRKRQIYLSKKKHAFHHAVREEIKKRFSELAECFLGQLTENYEDGRLEIYHNLKTVGTEKFEIIKTREKLVRFSRKNLIMELTPDTIMEEFAGLIDRRFSQTLKEMV